MGKCKYCQHLSVLQHSTHMQKDFHFYQGILYYIQFYLITNTFIYPQRKHTQRTEIKLNTQTYVHVCVCVHMHICKCQ